MRASYTFETALRIRGERWVMTERLARDGSAIFRQYDELFPEKPAYAAYPPREPEGDQMKPWRHGGSVIAA